MSTTTLDDRRATAPTRGTRGRGTGSSTGWGPAPDRSTTSTTSTPTTASRRSATTAVSEPSGATAPFVLLIMVLLTCGLVATLGLSTAAAADSYRLEEARGVARDLTEQSERLHREVEAARSAPALAAAATAQGLVPAGNPAVLLVAPDGSSRVIGDARPAPDAPEAPARRAPAPAAAPAAPATPAGPDAAATPDSATPAGPDARPDSVGSPDTAPSSEDEQLRAAPAGTESGR